MPDYANRESAETTLARLWGRVGRDVQRLILDALGDPPDYARLDEAFWSDIQARYEEVLLPTLESIYIDSAEQMAGVDGIPPADYALVNEAAAAWARRYTFELVRGINYTSRQYLQRTINDFFQTGMNMRALQERIARQFGTVRASRIAVTEVTRAAVEGERAIVAQLAQSGIQMAAVWQTSNDDIVCRICSPLNGLRQGDGWVYPPPAHVGCRCWINYEFVTS